MFFFYFAEAKLNSVIAVFFFGFILNDNAGAGFNYSNRNQSAVSFKNLSHTDFFT